MIILAVGKFLRFFLTFGAHLGPSVGENTKISEFRDFNFVCLGRSRVRNRKLICILIAVIISKFHVVSGFFVGQNF